jgi:hypothetical protein
MVSSSKTAFPSTFYRPTPVQHIEEICRGGSRPLRRSYLDQQWRTQYVIGEQLQYVHKNLTWNMASNTKAWFESL